MQQEDVERVSHAGREVVCGRLLVVVMHRQQDTHALTMMSLSLLLWSAALTQLGTRLIGPDAGCSCEGVVCTLCSCELGTRVALCVSMRARSGDTGSDYCCC